MTPETPPVVLKTNGVSLADKLRLAELPLATTPGGKNFTMKALHPSEHTIKSARVPGGNKMSVALCCDMVQTIPLSAANDTLKVVVSPNIVVPCSVEVVHQNGSGSFGNFYNAAFGGSYLVNPTYTDTFAQLNRMIGLISEYRITSQSVTCELIAPSLSDQGTITAAQYDIPPQTVQISWYDTNTGDFNYHPDLYMYPEQQSGSTLVLGSSAYTAKARDGVYLPLKLTKFKWMNFTDRCIMQSMPVSFLASNTYTQAHTTALEFPYYENRTSVPSGVALPSVPKCCGNNFGIIDITGTAANVSVRIRVRQVVEITARPSTTYAPLLEVALPPDETAMRMYQEISSKMADGYPASYNDLGKLGDIIRGIGKKVLPFVDPALNLLSNVPGPVGAIASGAKVVKNVAQKIIGPGKSDKGVTKPAPQAAKPARK